MKAQLLHLSGPFRGHTKTHDSENLLVGTAPDAHVRFPEKTSGVKPRHAELALHIDDCCFYLRTLEGQVFVNRKEVKEIVVRHGDLLEFGTDGPKVRFRIWTHKGAACKPVRQMLGDAAEVGHESGAFAFSQSFIRDLFTQATLTLKIGVPVAVLLAVLVVGWFGGWIGQRTGGQRAELKLVREEFEAYKKSTEQRSSRSQAEVERLREEFGSKTAVVDRLIENNKALKKVLREYSRGVCLIHGIWSVRIKRGSGYQILEDSLGRPLRFEYVGSGFLVSKGGHVLTNRHVAEPWWRDARVQSSARLGYKPFFERLTATFPGKLPTNIDVTSIKFAKDAEIDLAALKVKVMGVPVLPLYTGKLDGLQGDKVILLGYPTGMNALLAKADAKTLARVRSKARNLTELITGLAMEKQITPHATQGAVNEIGAKQLVYDAPTTSGGSGGPVFSLSGQVIGINAARLTDYVAANYGVPVAFAFELMK